MEPPGITFDAALGVGGTGRAGNSKGHVHMATSIHVNMKTRKERPLHAGELVGVRFQPEPLRALDEWRRKQPTLPNRAEAIRRLIEQALEQAPPRTGATPPAKAQKAMEIASDVIDKVADKSLPAEEQQRRKRALIRGPKEFRDIRGNQQKTKR